jgi:hypothetical protein
MGKTLTQIAADLLESTQKEGKKKAKVQLIYAFNGTGKTRLSREFKFFAAPKNEEAENFQKILNEYSQSYHKISRT